MKHLLALLFPLVACGQITWGPSAVNGSPPVVVPQVVNVWSNYATAVGTTLTTTIAPSAGNLLVTCISTYHQHTSGFLTNGVSSAGFTYVTNTAIGAAPTWSYNEQYYLKNLPATITSLTLNMTADGTGGGYVSVVIYEISGCSTTTPFTAGEMAATPQASGVSTFGVGPVSNGTANSICIASITCVDAGRISGINASGTATANWTLPNAAKIDNATGGQPIWAPYLIVSGTGAQKQVWTVDSASAFVAVMGVYH